MGNKPVEKSFFGILINDAEVDKEMFKAIDSNLVALKTWVPRIKEMGAREQVRGFIENTREALAMMTKQKAQTLKVLRDMEAKWQEQQKLGTPPATPEPVPAPAANPV